jgi:kelch-like protein 1/4/5
MFNSNLRESNESEIIINEVDGEILELLIRYCYAGSINITEDNVERILSTACLFQMSSVVTACSNFLGKQLHFSNAIGFVLFAEQQSCDDLHDVSLNFVESNFMEIYEKSEEFLRMDIDQLTKLLKNDELNVNSEEDVFYSVKKWINHSDDRIVHIPTLLSLIKLPQLTPEFIADNIEKMCSTIETQKMLLDAYKFQLIPERRNLREFYAKPRKSTVGKLLSIGGMDSQKGAVTIESYDLRDNKWSLLKNMPTR